MSGQATRCAALARRQRGISLVTAIFLMVVLSALGVALVGLVTRQQASSSMDERGARAYQAARAGIEWGLFQQLRLNACQPSTQLAMPATATTLAEFSVTVACVATPTPASGPGASPGSVPGILQLGSAEVTGIADTSVLVEGMRVAGTGIAPGTRVVAVFETAVTLSKAASTAGTFSLSYSSALERWQITATACSEAGPGGCPNPAPAGGDYVQRQVQVQF